MISDSIAYNRSICISDTQREKNIRTRHTIKNPNFFVIDKIPKYHITKHNKNYYFFQIKCDFKLIFNSDFALHIETDFYHKTSMINLK